MVPAGMSQSVLADAAKTVAAMAKVEADHAKHVAEGHDHPMYLEEQWCMRAVATDTDKSTGVKCPFATQSKGKYTANFYCQSIDGHFYPMALATGKKNNLEVTAKDNKGKVVVFSMTFTPTKAKPAKFSAITNNADLLKTACAVATQL